MEVFSSNSFLMPAMRSLPFIWFCIVTSIWAKRPVSASLAAVQAVNVSASDSLLSVISGFKGACWCSSFFCLRSERTAWKTVSFSFNAFNACFSASIQFLSLESNCSNSAYVSFWRVSHSFIFNSSCCKTAIRRTNSFSNCAICPL